MSGERTGDYDALYRNYIAALRELDHLSTLREIALAINTSLELEEILPTIADVVHGALDVNRITLYEIDLRDAVAQPLVAKFGRDLITRERLIEEEVRLERHPMRDALETRMPVLLNTADHSALYIPLIAKGIPLGALHLEDPSDGAFKTENTTLYQTIGSMIAIAINNAQLYSLAVTDGLTKLYVRRYFDLRMEEEFDQAQRYGRDFSLLMFDIDHFKKFNDTHGHQTGDMVLQQFAQLLKDNTRKSDICCRYGGEEMCVVLPETNIEEATRLAQKLCQAIRTQAFKGVTQPRLNVTSSIGVAAYTEDFATTSEMVAAADQALYRAKENGRNQVQVAETD